MGQSKECRTTHARMFMAQKRTLHRKTNQEIKTMGVKKLAIESMEFGYHQCEIGNNLEKAKEVFRKMLDKTFGDE